MEKVLSIEPWSFDKHLMVLQRYDKDTDVVDMKFNMVTFWVQVHNIPVCFRTRTMAVKICGAIDMVNRPTKDIDV